MALALFTAYIGLPARLAILALQAWTLYWWFKRQRRLDTLGNIIRVAAITAGVGLMFLWISLRQTVNSFDGELQLGRFVGLPACALIVFFLFFPDASYFVAQGLRKLFHREPGR